MNDRLDRILESTSLEPPDGFTARVIAELNYMPAPRKARRSPRWIPWVAILCGFVLSIDELISFIFSAWITVTAN